MNADDLEQTELFGTVGGVDDGGRPAVRRFIPKPPTGPQIEPPERSSGRREVYEDWRRAEGREAYDFIEREALDRLRRGDKRISVGLLTEMARDRLKVRVLNAHRAHIADDLVIEHPPLLELIQRNYRPSEHRDEGGVDESEDD